MSACDVKFIGKGCMCLADPRDPRATICGYINKQNGLVYPCDLGCCLPRCMGVGQEPPVKGAELRKSKGTALPDGFNVNLPQSDEGTAVKGATNPTELGGLPEVPYKVWQIVLALFVILAVAIGALLFLA